MTRGEPPSTDATLRALTLSGVDFGSFDSTTTTYTAQVANSVSETRVSPTVNNSAASYVIRLGGVNDADGAVSLAVGSNVITVEVKTEDRETTKTYTITVTRAEASASTDAAALLDRYDADGDDKIDKGEVIEAINDYLFGTGDEQITKAEVIEIINLYLFG